MSGLIYKNIAMNLIEHLISKGATALKLYTLEESEEFIISFIAERHSIKVDRLASFCTSLPREADAWVKVQTFPEYQSYSGGIKVKFEVNELLAYLESLAPPKRGEALSKTEVQALKAGSGVCISQPLNEIKGKVLRVYPEKVLVRTENGSLQKIKTQPYRRNWYIN